jgi:hypothetical protein
MVPASRHSGAMRNPLDSEQTSPDERIREIAQLLATGFLRHWVARSARDAKKAVAIRVPSSDPCIEPTSEGETP